MLLLYVRPALHKIPFFPLTEGDLVPRTVNNRQELLGRWATFTSDHLCQRQLIVLEDFARDPRCEQSALDQDSKIGGTFDTLARGNTAALVAETRTELEEAELLGGPQEGLLKKLSRQMGRGKFHCLGRHPEFPGTLHEDDYSQSEKEGEQS